MVSRTLNTILASAVALTFAATTAHAETAVEKEKCYGVVKAGKNDCAAASGSHSCGGQAPSDRMGDEWVAVPKGLCERLAGGSLTPVGAPEAPAAATEQMPMAAPAPAPAAETKVQ